MTDTDQTIAPYIRPSVSDAYRKAHKSYVLFSGLLAAWELIGITLSTKEKWGIELKSPAAVPLILIVLVFYFGYRVWIEWIQCDRESTSSWPARMDYRIAHVIAFGALGIAVVQYLWRIQIVNAIQQRDLPNDAWLALNVFLMITFTGVSVRGTLELQERGELERFRWWESWRYFQNPTFFFIALTCAFAITLSVRVSHTHGTNRLLLDLFIGIVVSLLIYILRGILQGLKAQAIGRKAEVSKPISHI